MGGAWLRLRQAAWKSVYSWSSQSLQIRHKLLELLVTEAEIWHQATRFDLLGVFQPAGEILVRVVEHPGCKLATTGQVREVRPGGCSAACADRVTIGAGLGEEKVFACFGGLAGGRFRRPRLPGSHCLNSVSLSAMTMNRIQAC